MPIFEKRIAQQIMFFCTSSLSPCSAKKIKFANKMHRFFSARLGSSMTFKGNLALILAGKTLLASCSR
jgi:hypothetical protein